MCIYYRSIWHQINNKNGRLTHDPAAAAYMTHVGHIAGSGKLCRITSQGTKDCSSRTSPATPLTNMAANANVNIDEGLEEKLNEQLSFLPERLLRRLMTFQKEGVLFALNKEGR